MTDPELKQFYEKLYFLEIESRDKIHARLQIPLTLLLALLGGIVFVLQNFDYQSGSWTATRVTFVFLFCCAIIALIVGLVCFVFALYNHSYLFLPTSQRTADYKALLEETYKDYEQRNALVSDALDAYLVTYYIQYATHNTQVNDRRSAYIHLCNGAIITTAVLFIAAYLAFYFGDLDKSKIKTATEVFVTKPVEVRIEDKRK